jgi:hypothetical protein
MWPFARASSLPGEWRLLVSVREPEQEREQGC